jgi:DNA-binding NtrC family response regulator
MPDLLVQNGTSCPDTQDGLKSIEAPLSIEAGMKAEVRILLGDGELALRAAAANVLRHEGYEVVACDRAQEALDTLRHRAFDIVLVNLELPHVPGLTVLRAALATNADTIGIVMAANPTMTSCVEALAQGAWEYLAKPFPPAQLPITTGRAALMPGAKREAGRRRSSDDTGTAGKWGGWATRQASARRSTWRGRSLRRTRPY